MKLIKKEIKFIIQVIEEHKKFLREDARMTEKEIKKDDYLNKENIMANKLLKELRSKI
jgi:hypothetical protein